MTVAGTRVAVVVTRAFEVGVRLAAPPGFVTGLEIGFVGISVGGAFVGVGNLVGASAGVSVGRAVGAKVAARVDVGVVVGAGKISAKTF